MWNFPIMSLLSVSEFGLFGSFQISHIQIRNHTISVKEKYLWGLCCMKIKTSKELLKTCRSKMTYLLYIEGLMHLASE